MRKSRWLFCAFAWFACTAASRYSIPTWSEDVGAEWRGDRVYVQVEINRTPEQLLVDTGSDICVLSPSVVSQRGVSTVERKFAITTADRAYGRERHPVADVRLHMGSLGADVQALVVPLDDLSRALGEPVHGLLGLDAFERTVLWIDYPRRTIRISDGSLPVADGRTVLHAKGGNAIRVELPDAGTVFATVDTGSEDCLRLPEALVGTLSFKSPPRFVGYSAVLSGITESRVGRVDGPLRIGRYTVRDPLVSISHSSGPAIGTRLLQHFAVALDVGHSRIALDRGGPDVIEIPPLRGIGAGFSRTEAHWTVMFVLPGGSAERAGVREGDRVVLINGSRENLQRATYDRLIETSGSVRLNVQRGAAALTLDVPVEVLVE